MIKINAEGGLLGFAGLELLMFEGRYYTRLLLVEYII